ncbi:hypothetical protein A3A66_03075 [Microgenomates group bacterium RIFCSPLOWO2_01_FULL_46_13]|nr:MAG: hypothetical protein A2783_04930 [Microgenomates group bacterium RIFCSPHIGHO2_01_FULL_45_11]OGV94138.1 MAG: hypothetical protein A3A66_03075 [Microgenomates group bacterium RIFCSPLOWO2_01_FULL_46_13]
MPEDELVRNQQAILETKIAGPITVGQIVDAVSNQYDFDGHKPENLHQLHRGLETTKFTFWAGKEPLLLKIYDSSASRPPRFRLRNVSGLETKLKEAGVPISETVETKDRHSFITLEARPTPNRKYHVAAAVSRVFPGHVLTNPSVEDVQKIAEYMARIHQIKDYGVVPAMDSWSLLRLVRAVDNHQYFPPEGLKDILTTINPTVDKVRALGLDDKKKFPQTLVHGDLHSFNILKEEGGKYCILDLGCMDHEQRLADLAIFMSNTCADFTDLEKTTRLFSATTQAYEARNQLTPSERQALPVLIQANYAMFALRTAELLQADPDDQEIRDWHKHGMKGLQIMEDVKV